jgi:hypothetical protein
MRPDEGRLAVAGTRDIAIGVGRRAPLRPRRPGVVLWVLCLLLVGPTLLLLAIGPGRALGSDIFSGVGGAAFLVLGMTFASVGMVIAVRVPGNRIGWIFCVTGFWCCVHVFTWQYADVGLHSHNLPGAGASAVFNTIIGEALAGMFALTLLLFPDGRLPSPRWRPVLWSVVGGISLLVADSFRPGPLAQPFASQSNPLGLPVAPSAINDVDLGGWLLVLVGLVLGSLALVSRLRRARGIERQQLKLVLAVGTVAAIAAALLLISPAHLDSPGRLRIAAVGLILTAFPLATGVAILRYRLYDIDRVINRTIVYGLLTALLSAAYFGLVLLFELLLGPLTGGSGVAVALSTLTVAAFFRPARRRLQTLVDRRLYRPKYDAQLTLERLATRLRNQLELDALRIELATLVSEAMQPAHISIWIQDRSAPEDRLTPPTPKGPRDEVRTLP